MTIKLVAVTGCISGVAHTYMAAERLEKICQHEKWQVKIETQGALGIENALTEHDIRSADVVLLIADIELEGAERFAHCRCVHSSICTFLRLPEKTLSAVKKIITSPQDTHIDIS